MRFVRVNKWHFWRKCGHFHFRNGWCNHWFSLRQFSYITFCVFISMLMKYYKFFSQRSCRINDHICGLKWSLTVFLFFRMVDNSNESSPQVEKGWSGLKQHITENKINFGLWLTRCFTIIFTIGYVIPIFGYIYFLIFWLD